MPGSTIRTREQTIGALFAILSALGFAGKAIFIKVAYASGHMDATTLLALRMLFSLPFFVGMAVIWGLPPDVRLKDLATIAWLAFSGYYFSSYLDFTGLQYISAGLERIILFTYPTWVLLLSAVWLKRRVRRWDMAALTLSFSGLAVSFWHDLNAQDSQRDLWRGAALVLGASVTYSFYLLTCGRMIQRAGTIRFTAWVAILASVFLLLHFAATHPLNALVQPARIYWLSLSLAVFSTVLPILFLAEGIKRASAGTVAIASSVGPIITIFLGSIFLNEAVSAAQFAGAALVLVGVGMITRRPDPAPRTSSIPPPAPIA